MMRTTDLEIVDKETLVMKTKTVILWGREDSLGEGAELFLASRKEWEVIHITDHFDANFLYQEVERLNPDVVIIHQGDCAGASDIPATLVKNRPAMKVITVSLESNSLEVYSKQNILVNQVSDLFSVVET